MRLAYPFLFLRDMLASVSCYNGGMGWLEHDIEAILSITRHDYFGRDVRVGYVEAAFGAHIPISLKSRSDITEKELLEIFEDADPESRIALVHLDVGQRTAFGQWAAAARDFCEENIAGVFVLDQTPFQKSLSEYQGSQYAEKLEAMEDDLERRERLLCDSLPESFWKASLPILFDEGGVLSEYSPTSEVLDHDPHLSFMPCMEFQDLGENDCIVDYRGAWMSVMPVVDVTGLPEAKIAADFLIKHDARDTAFRCRHLLRDSNVSNWNSMSFFSLMAIIDTAFPNILNREVLGEHADAIEGRVGSGWERFSSVPYPVVLDRSSDARIEIARREMDKMVAICQVVWCCCADAKTLSGGGVVDTAEIITKRLEDVRDALGIAPRLEALCAGVPFADVMADIPSYALVEDLTDIRFLAFML